MLIGDFLAEYNKRAAPVKEVFFVAEKKRAGRIDPFCSRLVEIYDGYMKGGKGIRGALAVLGYLSAGRDWSRPILEASLAVEIFHAFLLIHDDWIDRDKVRHGKPTVHRVLEKELAWTGKGAKHLAGGTAFVLGDLGCFWSYRLLSRLNLAPEIKMKALSELSEGLIKTGYGEELDVVFDFFPGLEKKRLLEIKELKTAYYTLVNPLRLGLLLAGTDEGKLRAATDFGRSVGLAFQLHDDYLGLFGDEAVTGKSASSDLREGKKTLFLAEALARLPLAGQKQLKKVWGKRGVTEEELAATRELLVKEGIVAVCRKEEEKLVAEGKKAIDCLTEKEELREVYRSLADFVISRKK